MIRNKIVLRLSIASALLFSLLESGSAMAEPATAPSLKDLYAKYHAALKSASKVDDLKPYLTKRVADEMGKSPAPEQAMLFGMMKEMTPSKYEVSSEELKGESGILNLTSKEDPMFKGQNVNVEKVTGVIRFLKENGAWKIDKEDWNSKVTGK